MICLLICNMFWVHPGACYLHLLSNQWTAGFLPCNINPCKSYPQSFDPLHFIPFIVGMLTNSTDPSVLLPLSHGAQAGRTLQAQWSEFIYVLTLNRSTLGKWLCLILTHQGTLYCLYETHQAHVVWRVGTYVQGGRWGRWMGQTNVGTSTEEAAVLVQFCYPYNVT